jgi:hypothetical protein
VDRAVYSCALAFSPVGNVSSATFVQSEAYLGWEWSFYCWNLDIGSC